MSEPEPMEIVSDPEMTSALVYGDGHIDIWCRGEVIEMLRPAVMVPSSRPMSNSTTLDYESTTHLLARHGWAGGPHRVGDGVLTVATTEYGPATEWIVERTIWETGMTRPKGDAE